MEALNFSIQQCSEQYFQTLQEYVNAMCLDYRHLQCNEFLIALVNDELIGFGRIRDYEDCAELCSLGVVEAHRNKGVGKKLVISLIKNFYRKNFNHQKNLYVVTIIPKYFQKFGFDIVENSYPLPILEKYNYCVKFLTVPEKYYVMRFIHLPPNLQ